MWMSHQPVDILTYHWFTIGLTLIYMLPLSCKNLNLFSRLYSTMGGGLLQLVAFGAQDV